MKWCAFKLNDFYIVDENSAYGPLVANQLGLVTDRSLIYRFNKPKTFNCNHKGFIVGFGTRVAGECKLIKVFDENGNSHIFYGCINVNVVKKLVCAGQICRKCCISHLRKLGAISQIILIKNNTSRKHRNDNLLLKGNHPEYGIFNNAQYNYVMTAINRWCKNQSMYSNKPAHSNLYTRTSNHRNSKCCLNIQTSSEMSEQTNVAKRKLPKYSSEDTSPTEKRYPGERESDRSDDSKSEYASDEASISESVILGKYSPRGDTELISQVNNFCSEKGSKNLVRTNKSKIESRDKIKLEIKLSHSRNLLRFISGKIQVIANEENRLRGMDTTETGDASGQTLPDTSTENPRYAQNPPMNSGNLGATDVGREQGILREGEQTGAPGLHPTAPSTEVIRDTYGNLVPLGAVGLHPTAQSLMETEVQMQGAGIHIPEGPGEVVPRKYKGTKHDQDLYKSLQEMLEDDIMSGLLRPMTHSQKKVNKREAAAMINWAKHSLAEWKDESKERLREVFESFSGVNVRLEDRISAILMLVGQEIERMIDRTAAICTIPLSLIAREQIVCKRLAYDVKSLRIQNELFATELASITNQEREAIKLKFSKMGAMYDKPPEDIILVGGDPECPFNDQLHQTIRIEGTPYFSPQHYVLVKTAEFIGDEGAIEQLRNRTSREGLVVDMVMKFDPVKYGLKENELNQGYLGNFYKEAYKAKIRSHLTLAYDLAKFKGKQIGHATPCVISGIGRWKTDPLAWDASTWQLNVVGKVLEELVPLAQSIADSADRTLMGDKEAYGYQEIKEAHDKHQGMFFRKLNTIWQCGVDDLEMTRRVTSLKNAFEKKTVKERKDIQPIESQRPVKRAYIDNTVVQYGMGGNRTGVTTERLPPQQYSFQQLGFGARKEGLLGPGISVSASGQGPHPVPTQTGTASSISAPNLGTQASQYIQQQQVQYQIQQQQQQQTLNQQQQQQTGYTYSSYGDKSGAVPKQIFEQQKMGNTQQSWVGYIAEQAQTQNPNQTYMQVQQQHQQYGGNNMVQEATPQPQPLVQYPQMPYPHQQSVYQRGNGGARGYRGGGRNFGGRGASIRNRRAHTFVSPEIDNTPNLPREVAEKAKPRLILPPPLISTTKNYDTNKDAKTITVKSSLLRYQALGIDTAITQIEKLKTAGNTCKLNTYTNKYIIVDEIKDSTNRDMQLAVDIKPIEQEKFNLAKWVIQGGDGHGPTIPNTDPSEWDEVVFWIEKGGDQTKFYYNSMGAPEVKINGNNPCLLLKDRQEFLTTIGVEESMVQNLIQYPYRSMKPVSENQKGSYYIYEQCISGTMESTTDQVRAEIYAYTCEEEYNKRVSRDWAPKCERINEKWSSALTDTDATYNFEPKHMHLVEISNGKILLPKHDLRVMILGDSTVRGLSPHIAKASQKWLIGTNPSKAPEFAYFRTYDKLCHGLRLREHYYAFTAHGISGVEDLLIFKFQLEYADLIQVANSGKQNWEEIFERGLNHLILTLYGYILTARRKGCKSLIIICGPQPVTRSDVPGYTCGLNECDVIMKKLKLLETPIEGHYGDIPGFVRVFDVKTAMQNELSEANPHRRPPITLPWTQMINGYHLTEYGKHVVGRELSKFALPRVVKHMIRKDNHKWYLYEPKRLYISKRANDPIQGTTVLPMPNLF